MVSFSILRLFGPSRATAMLRAGLLDQLEGDVDKTTSGIREETKHAEDVAVSGQTFYMYVCIAILILVMVLELIIGLQ